MYAGKEWKWNQWDRVEIYDRPDLTLAQLIAHCDTEYGAELAMLSAGVSILYSSFSNPKKMAERKPMTLRAIYESVTKKVCFGSPDITKILLIYMKIPNF